MTNETVVTQSPLEAALLQIINTTTQAVGKGIDFLSEQIPDVIRQLLMWHATKNAVISVLLIGIAVILIVISCKIWKHGKNYIAKTQHDEEKGFSYFISGILGLISILPLCLAVNKALIVLKIVIAPKIFLIEYAAELIGK